MKNLFFYANVDSRDKSSGITKKVLAEIRTLSRIGFNVWYTSYTEVGACVYNHLGEKVFIQNYPVKTSKLNRYLRRTTILKMSKNFINNMNISMDFAYLRFHFFDKHYYRMLQALNKKGIKIIVESHAYPYRWVEILHFPLYLRDMLYERKCSHLIDLVAAMDGFDNVWNCKTVKIDNAVDLNEICLQSKSKSDKSSINLISVSHEQQYHNYKAIVKGLSNYYNSGGVQKFEIHFVGTYLKSTKLLINRLNLNNYFIFHGRKYGEQLDAIYNKADLGIGSFSYRAGSEYSSYIKTKEYFAKGLPFINGYREYAFDDTYPYVKRFEPSKVGVDFNEVSRFYNSIKNDIEMQKNMRDFAEENYSWDLQFERIFQFFEK